MPSISVSSNIPDVRAGMTKLQRKELPKAIRNALNDTAFDVRDFTVNTLYPRSFPKRRNRRFPHIAFRVLRKATTGRLIAEVGDRLDRNFLRLQIKGGVKIPQGNYIAIPTKNVRLTQRGPAKNQRPENLKNSFVADLNGRGPAIWVRGAGRGGKPGKLKMMYVLEPSAMVSRAFPFFKYTQAKVRQKFPKHIKREAKFAIKRAEKKINKRVASVARSRVLSGV